MKHVLKTWPEYYEKIASGEKTFEVRKQDRFFNVGDILILQEWSPVRWKENDGYSGKQIEKKVTYVMNGGKWDIPEGICIMGINEDEKPIAGGELDADYYKKLSEGYKKLLRIANCPDILIENPWILFATVPNAEDLKWAEDVVKRYESL